MLKKAAILAGAAAGLLAVAPAANADSAENDGINILDDNNVSVLPVQACGNNIPVIGLALPILSPQLDKCVNAPIVDHPQAG